MSFVFDCGLYHPVHHISITDGYDPQNDTDSLLIEFTFSTTIPDAILLFSNGVSQNVFVFEVKFKQFIASAMTII